MTNSVYKTATARTKHSSTMPKTYALKCFFPFPTPFVSKKTIHLIFHLAFHHLHIIHCSVYEFHLPFSKTVKALHHVSDSFPSSVGVFFQVSPPSLHCWNMNRICTRGLSYFFFFLTNENKDIKMALRIAKLHSLYTLSIF